MYSNNLNLISHPKLATSDLQILVNSSPIGGFRGRAGTIEIRHQKGGSFQDWTPQNLESLAQIYNQILNIHEQQGVMNTLVFGKREKNGQFSMSFVPYPRCDLLEKLQGTWHTIFGSPPLTHQQIADIKKFYEDSFSSLKKSVLTPHKKPKEEQGPSKKIDPFCRNEIIEKQKIIKYPDYNTEGRNYVVLCDNIPKGVTSKDPHFLIVPETTAGHVDGSLVPVNQRRHMLEIAQKVMRSLPGLSDILYVERNGSLLRGVQHQHINIIGIQSFPKTMIQKIIALIRQLFLFCLPMLAKLSDLEVQSRIAKYGTSLQKF